MPGTNGSIGLRLFGPPADVGVERGLAEFRAGRPVLATSGDEAVLALPVDGAAANKVAAFKMLCAPALPRLVITARRARVLGVEASGPVMLDLRPEDDAAAIWSLASGARSEGRAVAGSAGSAACAALELAKLAHRLPALLTIDPTAITAHALGQEPICVHAAAVSDFRQRVIDSVTLASEAQVPLQGVSTRFQIFRDATGASPTAIIVGEPDFSEPVPVRLHSACLTGDVFGSRRCDCGEQLQLALGRLTELGGGVILYLEQEGRGLGLANKMRAYALQDAGFDTVDANTTLGFDDDERDYGVAARILQRLGCTRVLLLTNNPDKMEALTSAGLDVSARLPLYTPINADNRRYLVAKAARAGHWLEGAAIHATDETVDPRPAS